MIQCRCTCRMWQVARSVLMHWNRKWIAVSGSLQRRYVSVRLLPEVSDVERGYLLTNWRAILVAFCTASGPGRSVYIEWSWSIAQAPMLRHSMVLQFSASLCNLVVQLSYTAVLTSSFHLCLGGCI